MKRALPAHFAWILLAAGASAQQAVPSQEELARRLQRTEARIAALEDLVRRQAEELAEGRRRLERLEPAATADTEARAEAAGGNGARRESREQAAPAPPAPAAAAAAPASPPFTLNGLVQAWFASGDHGFRDTFKVRRAELAFGGEVGARARWQVMLDPAKALALETQGSPSQASRALQNAFVTLDHVPGVRLSVGQFKLPLSLEGQQSSGRLETVERALFLSDRARGGAYGDVRDIGILARGSLGRRFDFQAGVYNGVAETQNDVDHDDQKALAGSLTVRPREGLQLGGSGAWGNGGGSRPRRDRLGLDLLVTRGEWTLKSELMTGHDGPLTRRGYYGHVGYRVTARLEGVLRLDAWDPDTSSEATPASAGERDWVFGANLFLVQHNLKLQANFLRKTFPSGFFPPRSVLLVNTQTFW